MVLVVYFTTMSKRFLLWGGVVVGLFLIVLAVVKLSETAQGPSNDVVPEVNAITEYDHVKGDRGASIVLVEYSDLQCPACRTYYPMIKQLADENGERIAVIYRHFPLTSIHKNAESAARATVAAAAQDKFWEMHDLLFEKQRFWSEEKDIETLLKTTLILSLDSHFARFAGSLRQSFKISLADSAIAATAFLTGTQLVTRNIRDFRNIPDLQILKI